MKLLVLYCTRLRQDKIIRGLAPDLVILHDFYGAIDYEKLSIFKQFLTVKCIVLLKTYTTEERDNENKELSLFMEGKGEIVYIPK